MNEKDLNNTLTDLANQGKKAIVSYLRSQLTDEKPFIVYYLYQDYDVEPIYYFASFSQDKREKIEKLMMDAKYRWYDLMNFINDNAEQFLLENFKFSDCLNDFGGFAIIEKEKIFVLNLVHVSKRKSEWQLVQFKEE